MKKALITVGALTVIAIISGYYLRVSIQDYILELRKEQLPPEIKYVPTPTPVATIIPTASPKTPSASPVDTPPMTKFNGINLAVPFSSQAPYGNWNLPYLEACEETSALLVDRFYKNEALTQEIANREILKIVAWENEIFGYYKHTTAKETAQILKDYFGYKRVDVLYDITLEDIKAHLTAGRPLIVPLAGRMLNNPYYRQPGPIYHMLVVKGITKNGDFITHDVGTRRGADYVYGANLFYNAIHDAPLGGGELTTLELEEYIPAGRKAIVVVYPN